MKITIDTDKWFDTKAKLLLKAINSTFLFIIAVIVLPILYSKLFFIIGKYFNIVTDSTNNLVEHWFTGFIELLITCIIVVIIGVIIYNFYEYYCKQEGIEIEE